MDSSLPARYIAFTQPGTVELCAETLSTGDLAPMETVIENEVSLVSAGTELARLKGLDPAGKTLPYPARPGYACIGRIVAKGEGVTEFAVGDRVFYAGKHGSAQRFEHGRNSQWGRLYPVRADLRPEDAVFVCLAQIASTAPFISEIDLGDTVAVFGLGLVGNFAAQLYRILGARVIGLDPQPARCELALQTGIEEVVSVGPDEQVAAVLERTHGEGAEITVDAVGHSAVIENCVQATRLLGQVLLLGTPRAAYEANLTRTLHAVHTKGLLMRGAHMWRFPEVDIRGVHQTVPMAYRRLFHLISTGALQVAPLRSHLARPEEAPEIYHGLENRRDAYWGVVFDWR